jgi:hypothetical protein
LGQEVSDIMKTLSVLMALFLAPAGLFAQPSADNPAGDTMPSMNPSGGSAGKGGMHKGGGRHAHIHKAMNLCARAENQLKEAADDYGGHKEKAEEFIRQGKEELKAALEYAQQHRKQGGGKGGGQGQPSGGSSGQPEGPGTPQQ